MTNQDKGNLANALRDQVEAIIVGINEKSGYYYDLEHLDVAEVEAQLHKWLDRLPYPSPTTQASK